MNNRAEQLLDLYFSRTISTEDEAELRQLLAADLGLAREFSWQLQLARSANLAGLHHPLKQRLRAETPSLRRHNATRLRLLSLAAAALLLFCAAWWFFFRTETVTPPPNPVQIAMDHFEHFPNKIVIEVAGASDSDSIPVAVRSALALYDRHDYRRASQALQTVVQQFPDEPGYQFYYGVSLVGCQQFETAIAPLERSAARNNVYQTPAYYYLALANTGARRYSQARQALEKYLADTVRGVTYRKQAQDLLEKLPR